MKNLSPPLSLSISLFSLLTRDSELFKDDSLESEQWSAGRTAVEHLEGAHIFTWKQVVQGCNVLPDLHKQTSVETAHSSQP